MSVVSGSTKTPIPGHKIEAGKRAKLELSDGTHDGLGQRGSLLHQVPLLVDTANAHSRYNSAVARLRGWVGRGRRLLALIECRGTIDTHGEIIVAFAGLVSSGVVVCRHVPVAAQQVIDVIAVLGGIGTNASTEAELGVGDEGSPFMILEISTEGISVDQSTNGIAISISSMRVEFTSSIALADVDFSEVTNASNLNIIWRFHKVNTFEGSVGDSAGATTGLSAPRNLFALCITDCANTRGCPQAEIIDIIDPSRLALRALTGSGTTVICAGLTVLRLVGRGGSRVPDIPNLIWIFGSALPHLKDIAVSGGAISEIRAFPMISPGETVVGCVIPLLILVLARGIARPDLEFSAICVESVLDIETFGAKDLNLTVLEAPLLGGGTSARLQGDGRPISI